MRKTKLSVKKAFQIMTYMLRKQGTHEEQELWENQDRWVSYAELQEVFELPPEKAHQIIDDILEYLSAGRNIPENQLNVLRSEDDAKVALAYMADLPDTISEYQPITMQEALALKMSLKLWGEMMGEEIKDEVDKLIEATNGLIAPEYLEKASEMGTRIRASLPHGDEMLLRELHRASSNKEVVEFEYHDPATDVRSYRVVEPHGVFCSGSEWYLYAWCRESEDWRTFYLVGIGGLKLTGEAFAAKDSGLSLMELSREPLGDAELDIKVRVRFLPPLAQWAKEKVAPESLEHEKDGSVISTISVRSVEGMKSSLLGFGDRIQVLEPEELRLGLLAKAEELVRLYSA